MFAWLGLLPRTESLASLKKISYFLARRAAVAATAAIVIVIVVQGTRGDVERTKTGRLKTRGFHNVPVLRRQVSKLPLTHSPRLGKSAFNILATGREIRVVLLHIVALSAERIWVWEPRFLKLSLSKFHDKEEETYITRKYSRNHSLKKKREN